MAEKVFRSCFELKQAGGQYGAPQMTDLGKSVIPMSQIPVTTLYKRTLESFQQEFEDENIAELHFNHHAKRRVKNLLRLNLLIKMGNEGDPNVSMPNLRGGGATGGMGASSSLDQGPLLAYASAQ